MSETNLTAMSRACAFIAALRADDDDGVRSALTEAIANDQVIPFAAACGIVAVQLVDRLHGEDAQLFLDAKALDSAWFRDQELAKLRRDGAIE